MYINFDVLIIINFLFMKNFKKIVVLGVFVLVLLFAFTNKTNAATCTATSTHNWSDSSAWSGCGGGIPSASDDVIIQGTLITVDVDAFASSVTLAGGTGGVNLTMGNQKNLTVTNAITITAPSGTGYSRLEVDNGNVSAGSVYVNGATSSRQSQIWIYTGTLHVTGNITSGASAGSTIGFFDAGTLRLEGSLGVAGTGGTMNGNTVLGTVIFDGTSVQNGLDMSSYPLNVVISNSNGVHPYGDIVIEGDLTLNSGKLISNYNLDITGTTYVNGNSAITTSGFPPTIGALDVKPSAVLDIGVTSYLEVTGTTTIESGATLNENSCALRFSGDLVNNGTYNAYQFFTHTFSGNHSISGSSTTSMASVTIGSSTNTTISGTLSVDTDLMGGGGGSVITVNGGTLIYNGTGITGITLDANHTGSRVTYGGSVTQAVKTVTYYNLTLSGSGTKNFLGATTINNNLSIGTGVNAHLVGNSNAHTLTFGNSQTPTTLYGTWGSTTSSAAHKDDTYFSGTGTVNVPDSVPPTFTASRTDINTVVLTFSEPVNASADTDAWTVTGASSVSSTLVSAGTSMTLTTTGITDTGALVVNYIQANGDVADIAGNLLANGGSVSATDNVPPTLAITLSSYSLAYGQTATVTFTFSEIPTGFDISDVTVQNGTLSTIIATADPKVFTASFTPTNQISSATNAITVGTGWTDSSPALNPPAGSTSSLNFTINTVSTVGRSGGGGGGLLILNTTTPVVSTPPCNSCD